MPALALPLVSVRAIHHLSTRGPKIDPISVASMTPSIQSYGQKHAAEMATGRVKGVKAIAEEIEVTLPFEITRDDADVATAAVDRLAWDTGTPHDAIKVKVEKG